jgi:flagellin
VTTLNFASGTTTAQMIAAINLVSDATGVSASYINAGAPGSGIVLNSMGLGSKQFVSVQALPGGGTFDVQDITGTITKRDEGRDALALINGATSVGDGNHLTLKTASLDLELALNSTFGLGTTSFAIIAGGALFQVGPEVNSNLQVNIGVASVAASRLGNSEIGFLSQIQSDGDFAITKAKYREAQKIVKDAIRTVAVQRGRLGAFEKNTLQTNANQLGITMENLMAAESSIRDADFAHETSMLSRNQILVASGTSVLGLAQQTPQNVLQLLQ